MAEAIRARGLEIGYELETGPFSVLGNLDLSIAEGEFLTILGPSGCGKSTLLRVIADLLEPLDGTLQVLGETPAAVRARRDVAFVFQDSTLLPWRTVRGNVELPLLVGRRSLGRQITTGVDELFALVGLAELAERFPHQLSGGQRQRVSIARALLCNPRILLMDEPFGALDEMTRDRLNDELLRLWRRTGATILFVTHSIMEAAYMGQRVLVLGAKPGRVKTILDLRPIKDATGHCSREAPALVEAMGRLRQELARE